MSSRIQVPDRFESASENRKSSLSMLRNGLNDCVWKPIRMMVLSELEKCSKWSERYWILEIGWTGSWTEQNKYHNCVGIWNFKAHPLSIVCKRRKLLCSARTDRRSLMRTDSCSRSCKVWSGLISSFLLPGILPGI